MNNTIKDFIKTKKEMEKKYPGYSFEVGESCICHCHHRGAKHCPTTEKHPIKCLHCL